MNNPDPAQRPTEELVVVHRARDACEGAVLQGWLRDNGIEAELRQPPAMPPLDSVEMIAGNDQILALRVLANDAPRAEELIREFLATATDDQLLEDAAAETLPVDRDTIRRLRGELEEERQTFEFLEWVWIGFWASAVLLWLIWPPWLKATAPVPGLRWIGLLALAITAGWWIGSNEK